MFYSVVVPTYNRHSDVAELLESLAHQEYKNFEVLICDNSPDDSLKNTLTSFENNIQLKYFHNKDLGASESRNLGAKHATGDFLVFIDSDCIVPIHYLKIVNSHLTSSNIDAYGGPDSAHTSFTTIQKAINYSMTSFYTTGGIRGGSSQIGVFQPRSFNMGVKREIFNKIGGFRNISVSEDIDLSLRLYKHGCNIVLIKDAYVYHKRRTTFAGFLRQVFAFGKGRYNLKRTNLNAIKIIHIMPSIFVVYMVAGLVFSFFSPAVFVIWLGSLLAYSTLIFFDSLLKNRSIVIGLLSIYASFLMLVGYGTGMIHAFVSRHLRLNN